MDTEDTLRAVIGARGTTTIIYHGGSAPGTARAIAPIAIEGAKLVARCLETDARKTFMLAKVEMAGADPITPYSEAMTRADKLKTRTFDQWVEAIWPDLMVPGWHIVRAETRLAIHDFTRYGKPRVAPLIAIEYREFWTTTEYDMDTDEIMTVTKRSLRPWNVQGHAYGSLAAAFAAFIERYEAMVN